MRFVSFDYRGMHGLGVMSGTTCRGWIEEDGDKYPGELSQLVANGTDLIHLGKQLALGREYRLLDIAFRPPLERPRKIICIGLNYREHAAESNVETPSYPAVFVRFASSLVGHQQPLRKPTASDQLDFEGELVAVIGKKGRNISRESALEHVIGYSIFNDGSIRDVQFKSSQWTMGKNFDATGAFGPTLVTANELPAGCRGMRLQTLLNDQVMQDAAIDDMVFDIPSLIEILSDCMTLEAGDVIVTGTPSGVGFARKPALFMKAGDVCTVRVEGIGELINEIVAD